MTVLDLEYFSTTNDQLVPKTNPGLTGIKIRHGGYVYLLLSVNKQKMGFKKTYPKMGLLGLVEL